MRPSEKNEQLQDLRALAMAVAEQPHLLRQDIGRLVIREMRSDLAELCRGLYPDIAWDFLIEQKKEILKSCRDQSICLLEKDYPESLRQIADPPWVLFARGAPISALKRQQFLAIVGSRRADFHGLELAKDYARQLAGRGVVIVSGLALGIDAAAHRGALSSQSDLSTIAVMGSGLDIIYPPAHQDLFKEIISSGGIILSQFEPAAVPYPSNFLNRNRLVSGLCSGTLVIQATLKSGSLVTARHALEQGKEVFVIPGDIDNKRFEGSNKLIQQGAHLVTSVNDIIEMLGLEYEQPQKHSAHKQNVLKSVLQNQIIKILEEQGQVKVDELVRKLGSISFEKDLLELEINGLIDRLPGNALRLSKA